MSAAVLVDRATIAAHVERLGTEIERDHPDGVVLVGVLKGALIFLADLARAMTHVDVTVDFMSISRFAPDSGRVKILHDMETDIGGRDVVVVEDIVDTGLTLTYLLGRLRDRAPNRLSVCAMLDRPGRRILPLDVDYVGCTLRDEYVLGYGLHVRDLYRNVPFVVAADRDLLVADPAAYVTDVYGRDVPGASGGRSGEDSGLKPGGTVAS